MVYNSRILAAAQCHLVFFATHQCAGGQGQPPRQKKVLDAHKRDLAIIKLDQLKDNINRKVTSLSNFLMATYLAAALATLERNNIQVQSPSQPSELTEQGHKGIAMVLSIPSQDDGNGVGHRDE